jgi:hypothetical protein
MVKGQLADLRKIFESHIEGLDYADLLENRAALTPSQSTFKGKRSVAPLVYICKMRIGDSLQVYRICPSDDIGKIKAQTSSDLLGVHRRKDKKAIKFPTEAPAKPAEAQVPAQPAEAQVPAQPAEAQVPSTAGGVRPRRVTNRVKGSRRTRRRRQPKMRGGVHDDIIRFADQLLNFYSLDQCDEDDRDFLISSERARIQSFTNIDTILPALAEPPADPDLIWEDNDRDGYAILLEDIKKPPQGEDAEMHPHKREALEFLDNEFYRFLVFCRAADPSWTDDVIINCFIRLPPETNPWQETLLPAYAAFKTVCAVAYRQANHAVAVRAKLAAVNAKKAGLVALSMAPPELAAQCKADGELMAALKQLTLGEDKTHSAKFAGIIDQIDPPPGTPAANLPFARIGLPNPASASAASAAAPFSAPVSLPSFAVPPPPPPSAVAAASAAPPRSNTGTGAAPRAAQVFYPPIVPQPPMPVPYSQRVGALALMAARQARAAVPAAVPAAAAMSAEAAAARERKRRRSAPGVVNSFAEAAAAAAAEAEASAAAPGVAAVPQVVYASRSSRGGRTYRRRKLPKLL